MTRDSTWPFDLPDRSRISEHNQSRGIRMPALLRTSLLTTLPTDAKCHMFRLWRGDGGALVVVVVIREAVCQPPDRVFMPELRIEVCWRGLVVCRCICPVRGSR